MAKQHNSWEIILAGLLLTAVAIYMVSNNSSSGSNNNETTSNHATSGAKTASVEGSQADKSKVTINLNQLEKQLKTLATNEEFKELENLKELEELKSLQQLNKELKSPESGVIHVKAKGQDKESIRKSIEEAARELEQLPINLPLNISDIKISKTGENTYTINPSVATSTSNDEGSKYTYERQLDAKGLNTMNFSLASSHIDIRGNDGNQIVVKFRSSNDKMASDEIRDRLDISLTRDESEAHLDMEMRDQGWFNFFNTNQYDVTIELPRAINTEGSTSGGHINLANLDGSHELSTSGGHIELNDVSGTYNLSTNGGHITVNRAKADLELETSGGHIDLNQANGNMAVETSGGNIKGSNLKGSLNAETSGGNIETDFQEVHGNIKLETNAGNINLSLPQTTSADVDLEGSRVDIGSGFNFSGVKEIGEANGTINGGGAIQIDCETSAGNVRLSGNTKIQ